ncbi:winged helix-turn-helix transcriptional regulator [Clostridium polynesiense]|uniref:winged helix-turn-helix transcriptional regulator n=1 Tax=Clostridium polynesiense TaxID=1325933 RepID=UPI001FA71E17|nr:helix-turn-helix domain-containing protein [Clostridium polynesiense]
MSAGDDILKSSYDFQCNLAQTLNIIGDKWTLLVLHRIYNNKSTFKELQQDLKPIPTNILSDRIKALEKHELIISVLYNEHPPRYKYRVTEKGRDFRHVFNAMILWANKYLDMCSKTVRHHQCEGEVDIRYYCADCDEYVEDLIVK